MDMDNTMKIKIDFDDKTKAILSFINDTQEGKYTEKKPDIQSITYKRLEIQEQESTYDNGTLLFGLTF
ncbi:hypothetical protein Barb6_00796 [Bacteroidales bacterium Barb6]|nr:hypothetical protein Barb6_00796 [Bacteroidales bacterium Barb6]